VKTIGVDERGVVIFLPAVSNKQAEGGINSKWGNLDEKKRITVEGEILYKHSMIKSRYC